MASGEPPQLNSEAFRPGPRRSGILLLVIGALTALPLLSLYASVRANHAVLYGRWYLGYLAVVAAGCLVAAGGLHRHRRWGAWLAWVVLAADAAFTVYLGEATWLRAAIPLALCGAIALEYQDLR